MSEELAKLLKRSEAFAPMSRIEEAGKERAAFRYRQHQKLLDEVAADRTGVWKLAELSIPDDVVDWAKRWKMPTLGSFLWCTAFVAGWRLAMASRLGPDRRREDGLSESDNPDSIDILSGPGLSHEYDQD